MRAIAEFVLAVRAAATFARRRQINQLWTV
jgi:hypothetical protein